MSNRAKIDLSSTGPADTLLPAKTSTAIASYLSSKAAGADITKAFAKPTEYGLLVGIGADNGSTAEFFLSPRFGTKDKQVEPAPHATLDLDTLTPEALRDLKPEQLDRIKSALRELISPGELDLGKFFFSLDAEIESDQWIYRGLLSHRDLAIWLGREKHRKSNFVLQLAICAALGLDFIGFKFIPEHPLRVCLIDYESKTGSLQTRYLNLITAMRLSEKQQLLLRTNLRILEVRRLRKAGHEFLKFPMPGRSKPTDTEQKFWADLVERSPADLYIIDPLRMLHSADENDSSIEGLLTEIQRVFRGAAVILTHHMRKQAENSVSLLQDMRTWSDGARGSSALKAHSDVIVLQERIETPEGEEIVHLGAFLKDGGDIDPMPLTETGHESFHWKVKTTVPPKLEKSHHALKGGRFKTKSDAATIIEKVTKVSQATAWRHLDAMILLKIVAETVDRDDGQTYLCLREGEK